MKNKRLERQTSGTRVSFFDIILRHIDVTLIEHTRSYPNYRNLWIAVPPQMFIILRGGGGYGHPPLLVERLRGVHYWHAMLFNDVTAGVMHLAGSTSTRFLNPDHINNDSWRMMMGHDATKEFCCSVIYRNVAVVETKWLGASDFTRTQLADVTGKCTSK